MPETNPLRELEDLRQEMAKLDARLVATLDERARMARKLGELRRSQPPSLPIADHGVMRELVARSSGDLPKDALAGILRDVFGACLSLELPVKVAFVGPEGGPGHNAARGRFGTTGSNLLGVDSPAAALEELSRKRTEFAVVPFETSTEGPLQATILALVTLDLRIVEVLRDTFELHVTSRAGAMNEIDRVYTTAADHALCGRFLAALAPRITVVDVKTARIACQLALEESRAAAIATSEFASSLGLAVTERNVRDADSPRVRHAVIGARPSGRSGSEATSFVFSVQDSPGSLLDVLKVFAERGIRLTKIQSHPAQGEPDQPGQAWRYVFYVEAAGHFTDRTLVTAFEEVKRMTRFFKMLGSYPTS